MPLPFLPPFATRKELKRIAKENGYKGYSRMKKKELVNLLEGPPPIFQTINERSRERYSENRENINRERRERYA